MLPWSLLLWRRALTTTPVDFSRTRIYIYIYMTHDQDLGISIYCGTETRTTIHIYIIYYTYIIPRFARGIRPAATCCALRVSLPPLKWSVSCTYWIINTSRQFITSRIVNIYKTCVQIGRYVDDVTYFRTVSQAVIAIFAGSAAILYTIHGSIHNNKYL